MDKVLSEQHPHWEKSYLGNADMFGTDASAPARKAAELFKKNGAETVLELGAGQGRDTLFFGKAGFRVQALDYSEAGAEAIRRRAQAFGLSEHIAVATHDVRKPLPFLDSSFAACYAHMLFCMAMTTAELKALAGEVARVLRPGGICIYTVRHTGDPHYGVGTHYGEDMYETGGFIVHFFSREMVKKLAAGFTDLQVSEFEEGSLPRKLFLVSMRTKHHKAKTMPCGA